MRSLPLLLFVACQPSSPDALPEPHPPATYPVTEAPYTTLQGVWAPISPDAATEAAIDADELTTRDHAQFGDWTLGVEWTDGNPWTERVELAPAFSLGTERRSLAWVWQLADPQLIDEESPIRLEAFEPLYRPHGHLSVQILEAHVRTADKLAQATRPFDFALFAGDLTDSSQSNEMDWFLTAIAGGDINPDSGADDDPVPGPGNDYNDPFTSVGLAAPWYAVLGNHDALHIGGFGEIDEALVQGAQGAEAFEHEYLPTGWLDGSTTDAALVTDGSTPRDPQRRPLRDVEMLQRLHEADGLPEGHGLTAAAVEEGRGYYSVLPMAPKPIRLIGLHTVDSSVVVPQGVMDEAQLEWLQEELAAAEAANEMVIVMSHHRAVDFAGASPVSGDALAATLAASDAVAVHVVGHGHSNTVDIYSDEQIPHGYYELMMASTVDFPMQSRLLEFVDEGNGYLSIYATNVDHNSLEDSLAHHGRFIAAARLAFPGLGSVGDIADYWRGELEDQNLLLRVPIPDRVRDELDKHEWSAAIESETSLLALTAP
ncbi:MAG: metallophosphoesterase [Proteobacteria bacterium]|nr:metallophosphoesterase [Pseudomonadota bacterium]